MLTFYYSFWIIFIITFLIFLTIKFVINFFKINKIKTFFVLFWEKSNKLILFVSLIFIIVFWSAFYSIFYIRNYRSLRITEIIENGDYSLNYAIGCEIGSNCKLENLNINFKEKITLEITDYSRNSATLKLDTTMYMKKCYDCNLNILAANKEYKILLNETIFLEVINKDADNRVYYIVDLY